MFKFNNNFLFFLSIFLICIGFKSWLIFHYSFETPIADQWDGEAWLLYKPWIEGNYTWNSLFSPHNEHRIVITRIYSLVLLILNGIWNPQFQMLFNAIFHILAGIVFLYFLQKNTNPLAKKILSIFTIIVFSTYYSFDNTLSGFQSQFYFLVLFSIISMYLLAKNASFSKNWIIGLLCIFFASISLSTGFLVALVGMGFYVFKTLVRRRVVKLDIVSLALLSIIFCIGYYFLTEVPHHAQFKAFSLQTFMIALGKNMSFPFIEQTYPSLFIYSPFVILLLYILYKGEISKTQSFLVYLGFWSILQAIALAYGRGSYGVTPTYRYLDLLSIGVVLNVAAIFNFQNIFKNNKLQKYFHIILIIYCSTLFYGLYKINLHSIEELDQRKQEYHARDVNTYFYMQTDDFQYLLDKPPGYIPYPGSHRLKEVLDDKTIASILPYSIRKPLKYSIKENENFTKIIGKEKIYYSSPLSKNSKIVLYYPKQNIKTKYVVLYIKTSYQLNISLYIIENDSNKIHSLVQQKEIKSESWSEIIFKAPKGNFSLVAIDENDKHKLGFTEPTEIGTLTLVAKQVLENWFVLIFFGGIILYLVKIE